MKRVFSMGSRRVLEPCPVFTPLVVPRRSRKATRRRFSSSDPAAAELPPPPTRASQHEASSLRRRIQLEVAERLLQQPELRPVLSPALLAQVTGLDKEKCEELWPVALVAPDPDDHDDGLGSDFMPRKCGECDKFVLPTETAVSRYKQTLLTLRRRTHLQEQFRKNKAQQCRQVYVYGLRSSTTERSLAAMFQRYGEIKAVHILPRMSGDKDVRGVVRFAESASATKAFKAHEHTGAEHFRVRLFIPNRPPNAPPKPGLVPSKGSPMIEPSPKEKSYKFGMKLLTILTEHPEGISLQELASVLQHRFAFDGAYKPAEFYSVLFDRFPRYFTLSSGLLTESKRTNRTLFLRPSTPDAPPFFRGSQEDLHQHYINDMRALFKETKAGAYLSQLPDLWVDKFGYIPKTLALTKLAKQIPGLRISPKTVSMPGGDPFWDWFLRMEGDYYHVPQEGAQKLTLLLNDHPKGIAEPLFENAWYRRFGPLWTTCPEQLAKSIQAAFPAALFYVNRHGSRVYAQSPSADGRTSGSSRLGVGFRGVGEDVSTQDVFDALRVAGTVSWVAIVTNDRGDCTAIGCFVVEDARRALLQRGRVSLHGTLHRLHRRRDTPPLWEEVGRPTTVGKLFVTGPPVHHAVTVDELKKAFSLYSTVTSVLIVKRAKSSWWAMVEFANAKDATTAFHNNPEVEIRGKTCYLRPLDMSATMYVDRRIILKHLPSWVSTQHVMQRFGEYGTVMNCRAHKNTDGSMSGFGFIEFAEKDAADAILAEADLRIGGERVKAYTYEHREPVNAEDFQLQPSPTDAPQPRPSLELDPDKRGGDELDSGDEDLDDELDSPDLDFDLPTEPLELTPRAGCRAWRQSDSGDTFPRRRGARVPGVAAERQRGHFP